MMKSAKITVLVLITLLSGSWKPSTSDWRAKVDTELLMLLEKGGQPQCMVFLKEQADVSMAYKLRTKASKNRYVFEKLQQTAQNSQKALKSLLNSKGVSYHSLYIVNALAVKADPVIIPLLAARPDVAHIYHDPVVSVDMPEEERGPYLTGRSGSVEWGVAKMRAPEVWGLGFTGQGVVIGGQDTGYEWDHPALKEKYRGWNGDTVDHNYNWHDAIHSFSPLHEEAANPCGLDSPVPCDDHNHGTHTMGIMVGDDGAGNQVGVAPGARWIAGRNMDRGYGSPVTYTECFQWFLAPTDINGENPDPSKAPHVINNSWSCPEMEGCNPGNRSVMEQVVNNLKAAGIVVVVSAGNSGSSCQTVGDVPAAFINSFSVGAVADNDTIANFSSRGPVYALDSTFLIKPNVAAPGVRVLSSTRNGEYKRFSGTSMAGPHVAGAVALMISANPTLAGQVDTLLNILERTARPMFAEQACGPFSGFTMPNAVYGYGIIDVKAAVDAALLVSPVIEPAEEYSRVLIYPNPVQQTVFIERLQPNQEEWFYLYDLQGKRMLQQRMPSGRLVQSIAVDQLPAGIYVYRLGNEKQMQSGKLVKQ